MARDQIVDKRHPRVPFVILAFKCLALLMFILKSLLKKGEPISALSMFHVKKHLQK
jgi:hypothetical protein